MNFLSSLGEGTMNANKNDLSTQQSKQIDTKMENNGCDRNGSLCTARREPYVTSSLNWNKIGAPGRIQHNTNFVSDMKIKLKIEVSHLCGLCQHMYTVSQAHNKKIQGEESIHRT